jgi:A/G-specific adenine glycosylase
MTSDTGSITSIQAVRRKLRVWYKKNARDLPWRHTTDPYRILVSEVMLQQTRVAAVIPYYQRFVSRFPTPGALAKVPEEEVLRLWAGLGYYSRARNLQHAARAIVERGSFPRDFVSLRELPGVGDYTASAVASIAFGEPHAVIDGNVRRVLARLANSDEPNEDLAETLLDSKDPGGFNQAMMELGATICLPRQPLCEHCPLRTECLAHRSGTQHRVPARRPKPATIRMDRTLLIIRRRGKLLLTRSPRVKGFWDLPEPFHGVKIMETVGEFRHSIMNRTYRFRVSRARVQSAPEGFHWTTEARLDEIPLGTTARKALAVLSRIEC